MPIFFVRTLLLLIIIFTQLNAGAIKQKVLIITSAYNHPEYIALQHAGFKKFLKETFQFVVFNDASNEQNQNAIADACSALNIMCIRIPQNNRPVGNTFSWATYRHGQAVDYMMKTVGTHHNGIVILIDSDMFLIKKFSVVDYLEDFDIAGIRERPGKKEYEYLWPGLIFFRMDRLPNKENMCFLAQDNNSYPLDSGSSLCHYLNKNRTIKKKYFSQIARVVLNQAKYPLYQKCFPNKPKPIKCRQCSLQKKLYDHNCCPHKREIFRHLGCSKQTIADIMNKTFPHHTEFVLGDTFFHAVGSSGYSKLCTRDINKKNKLVLNYLMKILD